VTFAESKNRTQSVRSIIVTLPAIKSPTPSVAERAVFGTRSRSAAGSAHAQGGFTLLEIIVAMTLFFAVAGILASGVVQAMRLSESAATETTRSRDEALRLNWWRESVGLSIANGDLKEKSFQGEARRLRGYTLAQQDASGNSSGTYEWALSFSPETGRTALQYVVPPLPDSRGARAGATNTALTVAEWDGAIGGFRYLDENGNWSDSWPTRGIADLNLTRSTPPNIGRPAGSASTSSMNRPLLPVAVELTFATTAGATSVVLVSIQDHSPPRATMRELLQ
jgi:hypothetical protein